GKEREIQHMVSTSFWGADGRPLSSEEFITKIYGVLPDLFKNEEELRKIWSNPITRKEFLERLFDLGIDLEQLDNIQKVVNAENCDLFDVLSYLSYNTPLITRQQRINNTKENILKGLDEKHREFLNFILSKYEEKGVEELAEEKLPILLNLKYNSPADAINILGDVSSIRSTFFDFQEHLYSKVDV
ncbi:MAG: type I restriction-modification enzyme R subunit C-terminal domain-containing protein, partial [Tissierellia bacterium]|nr:type I restriction-modification enzyme R subunit C-terminal domain-containing protein [Tissierellia bacterium]